MQSPSPHSSTLRLPRGEIVYYPTGRLNVRILTRTIRDLGYEVWVHLVDIRGFQQPLLPRAVWVHAIVLGRVILFVANPAEESSSQSSYSDTASDQPEDNDSDNIDPDAPEMGH